MDVQNMGGQLFEHLHAGGAVVDESAAFGRRQYLATQNQVVVVIGFILGKKGLQAKPCDIKRSLHHTLALLVGQHLRIGPLSQQQSQGAQQDRLARTRLARDDGKPLVERHISMAYQRVVFYVQCL